MKEDQFEFRLNASDKKTLTALAEKFSYKNNLSAFICRCFFEREPVYEDIQGKVDICQALNKIGININQFVKSINIFA